MHVLEAPWEVSSSKRQYGLGTLERLERLGVLGQRFIAVHVVQVDEDDIERLAATGTHVVHCPESNLKLASGVSPVPELLRRGVNVSIGTDGAASNNNLDLLGEARTAALLAKGISGDPKALDAWQTLDLLTINGARALGKASELGSIEPGKRADLAAMDLRAPETQPLHEVHAQLVYSASSRQFSDVWVDGQRLLRDGELTGTPLRQAAEKGPVWKARLHDRDAPRESAQG
jgi:5-methylthioadenosine/S-adenosylhomocysteine deaminase